MTVTIKAGELSLAQLRELYWQQPAIVLDDDCWSGVDAALEQLQSTIGRGETVYGINTGFGRLAQTRIDDDELQQLQRNLMLSHATGVGEFLPDAVVRLILALKINTLARGYSGVRRVVIERLLEIYNAGLIPVVPSKGSVGASGDLAPLAHLSLPLIGEGEVHYRGVRQSSARALQAAGLAPLELAAKEGLALLNGTQVSTALALKGLFEAERNLDAAFYAGALTVEAVLGSHNPFNAEIHRVRGHAGQIEAARLYRHLLQPSEVNQSHADCDKVQDPYSLRCQPQVMGACLTQAKHVAQVLLTEANAVSDNPLMFPKHDMILSGGNFHAEPVAFVADNLALAVAEMGSISERRMALMLDTSMSQLPAFLVDGGGLNSGFMIAQVTAAALASENKCLAHPSSVDSIPTSANQEDHVSMATHGARRLGDMNQNTRYVLAVELLAAAQGLEFRRPLKSNAILEQVHAQIRTVAKEWDKDRYFQPDLEAVAELIANGAFGTLVEDFIEGSLQ